MLVAVEEQIEIDRARAEARPAAVAAEAPLDVLEPLEQRARRELGAERRRGVQEPRLILVADRIGLPERRDRVDLDVGVPPARSSSARRIVASRSPRFAAEPDVDDAPFMG